MNAGVRSADEVVDYINEHPAYRDDPPVRNRIMTRLAELVRKGRIARRADDGRYMAATELATESAESAPTASQDNRTARPLDGLPQQLGPQPAEGVS